MCTSIPLNGIIDGIGLALMSKHMYADMLLLMIIDEGFVYDVTLRHQLRYARSSRRRAKVVEDDVDDADADC